MPDSRFFSTASPLNFSQIAELAGARYDGDGAVMRVGAPDEEDLNGALIFCDNTEAAALLASRNFALCLTTPKIAPLFDERRVIVASAPKRTFALAAARLHQSREELGEDGGASAAKVDPEAVVHSSAVIAAGAEIGKGAQIGAHVYIGRGVIVGESARIESGVSITHAVIGPGADISAGVRIGQAGFGFVETDNGLFRIPQLGRVILGRDVAIGANTTIDRGTLGDTIISDGTKIDNLVQIGHNVKIGRYCVIAGHAGISGSCIIGDGVMIGGQAGLADHLKVGDGAQLAAGAGFMHDVPAGERWGGLPAKPSKIWLREIATLARLAKKKNGNEK